MEYRKTVKKRLIDIDKTQRWLCEEVSKKTGLYVDDSLLKRIFDGNIRGEKIVAAINEILEIEE
ncbi:MAG: XRE family transcriptional regulator [Clostridia bacterium]|nr:XRE family transcriptional regulator [Clostridia bacterium]